MKIFITGATGFIGGALALQLVNNGHEVTVLTRKPEYVDTLENMGMKVITGQLSNHALITAAAHEADAVINTASSNALDYVNTVIEALAGTQKAFIQTSGGFIVADQAHGTASPQNAFFTEEDIQSNRWLPPETEKNQVAVNRLVLDSARRGIRSIVICASLTYGTSQGLKRSSQVIPLLIDMARKNAVIHHIG